MPRKSSKLDKSNTLNGILFGPKSGWVPPQSFPDLSGARRIGLDFETKDPDLNTKGPGFIRGTAEIAGVSISTDDASWYFPTGHLGGGNLDPDIVRNYVEDVLSMEDRVIVGANLQYELEALWHWDIDPKGTFIDVQINEALIDEEREVGYSLNDLCKLHLGTAKDESLLREAAASYGIDPKNSLWKLPAKFVGPYAEYDSACVLKIYDKQLQMIATDSLSEIVALETHLLPVLHKMRMRGIPIDLEHAEQLSKKLLVEEDAMRMTMKKTYGQHVDEWSGKQIAAMCDKLVITYPTTDADNPSFVSKWLDEHEHPFIQLIADIRQSNKLRSTFVDSWIFSNHIRGRIHPQWKQLVSDDGGTRTGRMAASNPNPQQIPAANKRNGTPNPIGAEIRSLFISDTGKWCKQDYSQQEPRILTHFAAVCNFTGAKLAAMAYRDNPDMDFYNFMVEAAGINRRTAKDMYLGRCYGMGKKKLAHKINKSVEECEQILNNFDLKVPFVKEIADRCMHLAQSRGYIKTLCGRKRHFNYWEPCDSFQMRKDGKDTRPRRLEDAQQKWPGKRLQRADTHKALNALIQGSAADMMKSGLIQGYEESGRIPYITVHDEVGGPVEDEDDANDWKKTMETCVEMCVPIKADMSIGKSWK